MARKNISIGVDTWNDLSSLGKFGMTFDDIIKILMQQHKQLTRIAEANRKAQNKLPLTKFRDTYTVNLPAIKFPANKDEIIRCAVDANIKMTVDELKELPNTQYKDKNQLEKALMEVFKYKGFALFDRIHRGLYRVVVDDREIRGQQKQERLREQEEQLAQEFHENLDRVNLEEFLKK
jgi:hypothetical protein